MDLGLMNWCRLISAGFLACSSRDKGDCVRALPIRDSFAAGYWRGRFQARFMFRTLSTFRPSIVKRTLPTYSTRMPFSRLVRFKGLATMRWC